jgi:hypothetical protein
MVIACVSHSLEIIIIMIIIIILGNDDGFHRVVYLQRSRSAFCKRPAYFSDPHNSDLWAFPTADSIERSHPDPPCEIYYYVCIIIIIIILVIIIVIILVMIRIMILVVVTVSFRHCFMGGRGQQVTARQAGGGIWTSKTSRPPPGRSDGVLMGGVLAQNKIN